MTDELIPISSPISTLFYFERFAICFLKPFNYYLYFLLLAITCTHIQAHTVAWSAYRLNIHCFLDDHNRVKLRDTSNATGSDYINASYIVSLYNRICMTFQVFASFSATISRYFLLCSMFLMSV